MSVQVAIVLFIVAVIVMIAVKSWRAQAPNNAPQAPQPIQEGGQLTSAPDSDFTFTVEDVFNISGRGTVAIGTVETGTIIVGQQATIQTKEGESPATIRGIEKARTTVEIASEGDRVGVLLGGMAPHQTIIKGSRIFRSTA